MSKWKVLSSEYLIRKPWLTFASADRRRVARRATRGALRSKVARGRARCDSLELRDGRRLLDENAIFRSLMAAPLWRYFAEQERT